VFKLTEDRHGKQLTIFASQLPVQLWHEIIGEINIADAILCSILYSFNQAW